MTDNIPTDTVEPTPKRLLNVHEAAAALDVSKWMLYKLIASQQLRTVKLGNRRLVPVQALDEFVAQLESEPDATLFI